MEMADRRNYYEIIDTLSFDPIEMKDKKIIAAIEIWKLLEERRGISNEEANGVQRQQELDMYDAIKACLTNKESRRIEADAMKAKQIRKLNGIVAILRQSCESGKLYISNARLFSIAKSLRLDKERTVKKAFIDAGFDIISRKPASAVNDILLPNTIFNSLTVNIKRLNIIKNKDYPWLHQVRNLYDLAAFFRDDASASDSYPMKSATELKSMMEAGASKVAGKLDELNHCLADLFQAGATQIFKDDKTKSKYDNSLKLSLLVDLFALLKDMPEEMRKDSYIADICIKKIQSYFPDPDIALAIYNREAGNGLDPYEPDSGDVDFVCGSCKSTTRVQYGIDKTKCKCVACGTPLFVKCMRCDNLIPAVADICPECGFNLVESKFFDRYYALAKSAIDELDISEARTQLALAKSARPNDPRLKQLNAEINAAIAMYDAPMQDINNLINQGKYMQAQTELVKFCAKYPTVKVDDLKRTIDTVIDEADRTFRMLEKSKDPCGICFDILAKVKDYSKASAYIQNQKPKSVFNLSAVVSTKSNRITLQWDSSGEREVTYSIVRKESSVPQSINDGKIIAREQQATHYIDASVSAGVPYYYAVFAVRYGTYAKPVVTELCVLLKELDEKHTVKNAEDGKCVFSWQLPENCKGVRILRSSTGVTGIVPGNTTKLVTEYAVNGYEDKTVKNGTTYEYRLQCIYSSKNMDRYSAGITFSITPDSMPNQVSLLSADVKSENSVQIMWSFSQNIDNSIMNLYDVKPDVTITEGTSLHISELTRIGTKIGTVSDISTKKYVLRVSQKKGFRLCAAILKGEYAVISNCISFSTYDKLEIDRKRTKITSGNLILYLADHFHPNLKNIRYAILTKSSEIEPPPWCSIEDAPEMSIIATKSYLSEGMINTGKVPEKDLYISVIGEYAVGNNLYYSNPAKLRLSNKPKAAISYKIIWGRLHKKRNVKLIIECDMDIDLPDMILCCDKTIRVPMSANSPNRIKLCTVPEKLDYKAHSKIEVVIPDAIWNTVTRKNEIRLFLPEEYYSEFRMDPDIDTLKIP